MMNNAETGALTDRLGAAHGFSPDDLQANRLGRVTPMQAKRMRRLLWRRVRTAWRLVPLLTLCAILVVILYPTKIIWGLVFLLAAAVAAGIAVIRMPSMSQLQREKIEAVQGAVKPMTIHMEQERPNRHYYVVDGRKVEVSIVPKHKDPIALGEWYCVYFMPRYKWLLSIEPVEGPAAGSTGEHTLVALTGHWRPEEQKAGLPSTVEIRSDGTVIASLGALPVSGRLVVLDEHHIRIATGSDGQVSEWHVEVQGDRLHIKLPLHRHVDFVRVP